MRVSRRQFLGASTGAAATLFSFHPPTMGNRRAQHTLESGCLLVDLQTRCSLGESLKGYKKALAWVSVQSVEAWQELKSPIQTVIVPGAGLTDPTLMEMMASALHGGTCVLLESGAGFLESTEFTAHQNLLSRILNISIEPPVDLWACEGTRQGLSATGAGRESKSRPINHRPAPYVDYVWPHQAKVRDFSRVIPLAPQSGEVIGRVGAVPAALKRRVGKGTLIFLGSPLGPALRAGDPEATKWLRSVLEL